jgi:hypothetical protein
MRFNLGDEVILNSLANGLYYITREGSTGIVERVYGTHSVAIRFTHTTGAEDSKGLFTVSTECVDLVSNSRNSSFKYAAVINKIKQMDTRRKGLGYAF